MAPLSGFTVGLVQLTLTVLYLVSADQKSTRFGELLRVNARIHYISYRMDQEYSYWAWQ